MDINSHTLILSLMALLLPFFRIIALIHFSPILGESYIPYKIKVCFAVLLTLIITPLLKQEQTISVFFSIHSFLLIAEQIIWGFIFGYILNLVFIVLQAAGNILAFNIGLSMAMMNDPANGIQITVLSEFVYLLSILLFFAMDGHLLFITILYKSFNYWPIGQALHINSFKIIILSFGWIISSALLLALPTVFIMLIVQMIFGLLNRISPTLNLFSLGFPISMLAGIFCVFLLLHNVSSHYLKLTNDVLMIFDSLRKS